jgi:hypothetical protein
MYVLSWLFARIVALLSTTVIVLALPQSAGDELSAATVPHAMFSVESQRTSVILASCITDID